MVGDPGVKIPIDPIWKILRDPRPKPYLDPKGPTGPKTYLDPLPGRVPEVVLPPIGQGGVLPFSLTTGHQAPGYAGDKADPVAQLQEQMAAFEAQMDAILAMIASQVQQAQYLRAQQQEWLAALQNVEWT